MARSRLALDRSLVEAPFAGRIADLDVEVGQHVAPGDTLLTLLDDRRLRVEVTVLETDQLDRRVLVPEPAVLERQGREMVFRVEGDRALWTYVETGARSRGLVEIVSGLEAGDRVIVGGHRSLAHEARVVVDGGDPPGDGQEPAFR